MKGFRNEETNEIWNILTGDYRRQFIDLRATLEDKLRMITRDLTGFNLTKVEANDVEVSFIFDNYKILNVSRSFFQIGDEYTNSVLMLDKTKSFDKVKRSPMLEAELIIYVIDNLMLQEFSDDILWYNLGE